MWILLICTDNCLEVLFVFVCAHVSKYVRYVYMHVGIHLCSSVQVYGYLYMCIHEIVYMHMCVHACMHRCVHIYMYIHKFCVHVWACMCLYMGVHTLLHLDTALCVGMYVYTWVWRPEVNLVRSFSGAIHQFYDVWSLIGLKLFNQVRLDNRRSTSSSALESQVPATITDSFVDSGNPNL